VRTRTTLQKLGDEVRERRKKRNLTKRRWPISPGVHVNALKKLEAGKTNSQVLTTVWCRHGLKTPAGGLDRRE